MFSHYFNLNVTLFTKKLQHSVICVASKAAHAITYMNELPKFANNL